jgi:hypothetical protein
VSASAWESLGWTDRIHPFLSKLKAAAVLERSSASDSGMVTAMTYLDAKCCQQLLKAKPPAKCKKFHVLVRTMLSDWNDVMFLFPQPQHNLVTAEEKKQKPDY